MRQLLAIGSFALVAAAWVRPAKPVPHTGAGGSRPPVGAAELRLGALGHRMAAAELRWLDLVQYIGRPDSEIRDDEIYRRAVETYRLDPNYFMVYNVAATVLGVMMGNPDLGDEVAEAGREQLPDRWELGLLLGWTDYFIRADAIAAADHWHAASRAPDAPPWLASLSARALGQGAGIDAALRMLEDLIPQLPPGRTRDDALDRLERLRSEKILMAYDQACLTFIQRRGQRPESAEALYRAGLVRLPPVDTVGNPIELEFDVAPLGGTRVAPRPCVARTDMLKVRDFEAKERMLGSEAKRRSNR